MHFSTAVTIFSDATRETKTLRKSELQLRLLGNFPLARAKRSDRRPSPPRTAGANVGPKELLRPANQRGLNRSEIGFAELYACMFAHHHTVCVAWGLWQMCKHTSAPLAPRHPFPSPPGVFQTQCRALLKSATRAIARARSFGDNCFFFFCSCVCCVCGVWVYSDSTLVAKRRARAYA